MSSYRDALWRVKNDPPRAAPPSELELTRAERDDARAELRRARDRIAQLSARLAELGEEIEEGEW